MHVATTRRTYNGVPWLVIFLDSPRTGGAARVSGHPFIWESQNKEDLATRLGLEVRPTPIIVIIIPLSSMKWQRIAPRGSVLRLVVASWLIYSLTHLFHIYACLAMPEEGILELHACVVAHCCLLAGVSSPSYSKWNN